MRCLACKYENDADDRFCAECGAPLAEICGKCGAELKLDAKFCTKCGATTSQSGHIDSSERTAIRSIAGYTPKHLAEKILNSRSALEGERKDLTVMFADVKGSMELAGRLDPEEWHEILDRFFAILNEGVHRFEGMVNQYTGDGIMALFGAPIAHEDHAQRACYAALEIRQKLGVYADQLRVERGMSFAVRIGLNSGEVVVGKIGDDLRMDYTAQGQIVGLAQRIEQLAEPGRVYLSEHTQHLVDGYFRLRSLGASNLSGTGNSTSIFELEDVEASKSRIEVSRSRGLTRFVGRVDEMQTLDAALAQAMAGNGQVVGVVGEPGLGKSRLCLEFVERCRADGLMILEAHCPAHGKNIPFIPILQLYRSYFGIRAGDDTTEARRKIAGAMLLLDETLRDGLPVLFEFMGVGDPDMPTPELDADARQRQLVTMLHTIYRAQAKRGITMVLFIDDLHWIDPGSDAFLTQLFTATVDYSRNLLLLNFRPEYHADWMRRAHYHQLPLAPLGNDAIRELVGSILGGDRSLNELSDRIVEWTSGNPFYTEEVIQELIETGRLDGSPGTYHLARDVEELAVPVNVRSVLAARIDRLPDPSKQLLQTASVIGKEFPLPLLEAVSDLMNTEFGTALERLKEGDFVYERALYPIVECAFKHPLTQEVAYNSQLHSHRAKVHRAVARAFEVFDPDNLDERSPLLAYHWEVAGDHAKAVEWHRRAAVWSNQNDATGSLHHWRRVRELIDALPPEKEILAIGAEACSQILTLRWRLGGNEEDIERDFKDGRAFAERSNDLTTLVYLECGYSVAQGVTIGDSQKYVTHAKEAVRLADQIGEPELRFSARFYLIWAYLSAGRLEDALEIPEYVLGNIPDDGEFGVRIIGTSVRTGLTLAASATLLTLGRFDEAKRLLAKFEQFPSKEASPEMLWLGRYYASRFAILDGKPDAALDLARSLYADAGGSVTGFAGTFSNLCMGLASLNIGDVDKARDYLEIAVQIGDSKQGFRYYQGAAMAALGEACIEQGNIEDGLRWAGKAVDFCRSKRSIHDMHAWISLARAHILLGDESRALAALDEVQTLITQTKGRYFQPLVHEQRGAFAKAFGGKWSADEEFHTAYRLCAEMGLTSYAERLSKSLS